MATRSLTEVFILMRNNALQSRHIFSEQVSRRLQKSPSVTENLLANTSTPATPEAVSHAGVKHCQSFSAIGPFSFSLP